MLTIELILSLLLVYLQKFEYFDFRSKLRVGFHGSI
jgi:hypothetical protein